MELRLKEILAERGMTLKEFAQESGISASNLSNYVNGNISPTLETLNKIASHLHLELTELFVEKKDIELYAKVNGILYPISSKDIITLVNSKKQ